MSAMSQPLALRLSFNPVELKVQVHLPTCCPTLGEQAIGTEVKRVSFEGGEGIWWHCSSCHGWHVIVQPVRQSL